MLMLIVCGWCGQVWNMGCFSMGWVVEKREVWY